MSWRWYKSVRLLGGLRANISRNGVGYSLGFGLLRFGVSASGKKWVSIGVPGTGFRFFRYLKNDFGASETGSTENKDQEKKSITWKNIK